MADDILSLALHLVSRDDARRAGIKKFFTGSPCAQGHTVERYVKSSACWVCAKNATNAWRAGNIDRLRDQEAVRRKRDPTRGNKYKQEWKKRNPDKVREIDRLYVEANKTTIYEKAKQARRIESNRLRARDLTNTWRSNNPGKASAYVSARRAARINATPAWADLAEIRRIYDAAVSSGMTVDHIIPLKHPLVCGLHVPQNMQLLTPSENSRKGNKFYPY